MAEGQTERGPAPPGVHKTLKENHQDCFECKLPGWWNLALPRGEAADTGSGETLALPRVLRVQAGLGSNACSAVSQWPGILQGRSQSPVSSPTEKSEITRTG